MSREEWERTLFANVTDEVVQDSLNGYVLGLESENAKLRELVREAHSCKTNDGCCEDCYCDEGCCPVEQRMQELGIEMGE